VPNTPCRVASISPRFGPGRSVIFVTQVAARFGLVVSQKVAAQALPVVGALGGAAVNYAFIEHFQDVASGHFTVRRLERLYGKEKVRSEYDLIANQI
jgi:hypothetical protein